MKRQRNIGASAPETNAPKSWESGEDDSESDDFKFNKKGSPPQRDARQRKKRKMIITDGSGSGDGPTQIVGPVLYSPAHFLSTDLALSPHQEQDLHVYIFPEHLTPANPSLKTEEIWGSNPYAPESDAVCILQHSGLYDVLGGRRPPADVVALKLVLRIHPGGAELHGTERHGIKSRNASTPSSICLSALQFDILTESSDAVEQFLRAPLYGPPRPERHSVKLIIPSMAALQAATAAAAAAAQAQTQAQDQPQATSSDMMIDGVESATSMAVDPSPVPSEIIDSSQPTDGVDGTTSSFGTPAVSASADGASSSSPFASLIHLLPTMTGASTSSGQSQGSAGAQSSGQTHSGHPNSNPNSNPNPKPRPPRRHKRHHLEEIDHRVSIDVLPDTILQFNLSNELSFQYNLNLICDRGIEPSQWTSHRLRNAVLMIETLAQRYELSWEQEVHPHTATNAQFDTYRFALVKKPFAKTRSWHTTAHVPLEAVHATPVHSHLDWSQLVWGPATLIILGTVYQLRRIFWIARTPAASSSNQQSPQNQTTSSTLTGNLPSSHSGVAAPVASSSQIPPSNGL